MIELFMAAGDSPQMFRSAGLLCDDLGQLPLNLSYAITLTTTVFQLVCNQGNHTMHWLPSVFAFAVLAIATK